MNFIYKFYFLKIFASTTFTISNIPIATREATNINILTFTGITGNFSNAPNAGTIINNACNITVPKTINNIGLFFNIPILNNVFLSDLQTNPNNISIKHNIEQAVACAISAPNFDFTIKNITNTIIVLIIAGIIILHTRKGVNKLSSFDLGFLCIIPLSSFSNPNAIAIDVSVIKLIHNIWIGVRIVKLNSVAINIINTSAIFEASKY